MYKLTILPFEDFNLFTEKMEYCFKFKIAL